MPNKYNVEQRKNYLIKQKQYEKEKLSNKTETVREFTYVDDRVSSGEGCEDMQGQQFSIGVRDGA